MIIGKCTIMILFYNSLVIIIIIFCNKACKNNSCYKNKMFNLQ